MPPTVAFTSNHQSGGVTYRSEASSSSNNPRCDAARMAVLKKLRHKLVVLCSPSVQKAGGQPLPVLCFERWLARYAMRREGGMNSVEPSSTETREEMMAKLFRTLDPLIPSDGYIDMGLVKDLGRSKVPFDIAKAVATTLANESRESAIRVRDENPGLEVDTTGRIRAAARKRAKKEIKAAVKAVKVKSKNAQEALGGDSDDNNADIITSLRELKSATSHLEVTIQSAQKNVVIPITTGICGGISINGSRREGIYDITLKGPNGKPNRPYLTVSRQHLCKLIQLWTMRRDEENDNEEFDSKSVVELDVDPIKYIDEMTETDQPLIRMAIYCCLSRYEALRGAGYQCAVPGIAFDAASRCGLGTTIECFASPLNCRYRKYCSAFPDTERQFGSIGSFFDDNSFDPNEGSFQANPPFVPETMHAMGDKIQRLLDDPHRGPLSFLVVVPAWGAGSKFCQTLQESIHTRVNALIPAADHAFYDGAQHTKLAHSADSLLRPSSWDTAVILMQNDAGKKLWKVEEGNLRQSFCGAFTDAAKAIPENSSTLEGWEARGVAEGGSLTKRGLSPQKNTHIGKRRKR